MRGNRSIFVGISALVLAVGMLGANGYFWWLAQSRDAKPASRPSQSDPPNWPTIKESETSAGLNEEEVWSSPYRAIHRGPDQRGSQQTEASRRFFPHHTEAIEISQADGLDVPPAEADKSSPPRPPAPLLLPGVADPIEHPQAADWLSRLIGQELPEASAEERRVWSQELQGFEPEVVRDILRLRKNVMAGSLPRVGASPVLSPNWSNVPEADLPTGNGLVPPPLEDLPVDAHSVANRLEPSSAALEQARDVILNNLANTHTVGFKRSRVVLAPLPYHSIQETKLPDEANDAPAVTVGWGVELTSTPLDTSQGPLKKTNQPLDVAVEGPGFFQIRVGDEVLYTRCGMWTTNGEGQLCLLSLLSGNKPRLLEPPITVPEDAVALAISEDGIVRALRPGNDNQQATPLGTIELARFQNPSALKPRGGHLLAATKACGTSQTGSPRTRGMGLVRQGMLELSNVSRDEELEEFQMIHSHGQLLKHLANTSDSYSLPGPVARRPSIGTQRASAKSVPVLPPSSLGPLKAIRDQGRDLIEEYLQSERMKTIKRTLGLN